MSIIDSSVKPKNVTLNNGASISTTKSRFGGSSLALNGSGQYASIPDNTDFGFGTGDFTIEMWVYPLDNNNYRTLISMGTHMDGLLWRMCTEGNQLWFNGTPWNWGAGNVPLNKWSHLALVRNGETIKVYTNGTESLSVSGGAAAGNLGSSRAVTIGAYGSSETFNGYLDEIRITKGIGSARYTSNFNITPLLAPFPSSGTSISPPNDITNLRSSAGSRRITMLWNPPAEDNGGIITDYSVQYSSDSGSSWNDFFHSTSSSNTVNITGLVNDTSYLVKVAPVNLAGTGNYVATPSVLTPISPPENTNQDPYFYNTVLLLHMDGDNNSTTITDSSRFTRSCSTVGDARISVFQSKFGDSSSYFDGSGDYITVPDSAALDFGSGDFTVEYWEYRTDSGDSRPVMCRVATDQGYNPFLLGYKSGSTLYAYASSEYVNTQNWDIVSALSMGSVVYNSWTHYAFVRQGNAFRTYQNGIQIATTSSSSSIAFGNGPLSIGRYRNSEYYQGYLDDIRITKGICRYPDGTTFTLDSLPFSNIGASPVSPNPPTGLIAYAGDTIAELKWNALSFEGYAPLSSYGLEISENTDPKNWTSKESSTKLLLHFDTTDIKDDDTLKDFSLYNRNILFNKTSSPAYIAVPYYDYDNYGYYGLITPQKFGTGCLQVPNINTSPNYILKTPQSSDLDPGTGDYTLEFFWWPQYYWNAGYTRNGVGRLFGSSNASSGSYWGVQGVGNWSYNMRLSKYVNGSQIYYVDIDNSTATSSMNHFVFSRQNGTLRIFLNGNKIKEITDSNNDVFSAGGLVIMGGDSGSHNPNNYVYGKLDELRYTVGESIYNTNFDLLPQAAFKNSRIIGLTNDSSYVFRMRSQNSTGYGDYSSESSPITVAAPPDIIISQQPKNDRITTYGANGSFSIAASISDNSNLTYQWQKKITIDYNGNKSWTNIDGATSSSLSISTSAFQNNDYYYNVLGMDTVRCVLSSSYGSKVSKPVKLVNLGYTLSNISIDTSYNNYIGCYGNYCSNAIYSLSANGTFNINIQNYSAYDGTIDTSWYTGNDTRITLQYSDDNSTWNDTSIYRDINFNSINYYGSSISLNMEDKSGSVYYRFKYTDLWPYSTNNDTESNTESSYSIINSSYNYFRIDYTPSAPGAPSNVVADPGDTLAIVSWNAPTITGGATINSYSVQYSSNNGSSWTTFGTSSSTSLVVTNLSNGTNYVFRVAASNSAGTGSYSDQSSSINPNSSYSTVADAPTSVSGTACNTKTYLSWIAPTNIGKSPITSYSIQYSIDNGITWYDYSETGSTPTPTPTPTVTMEETPTPTPTVTMEETPTPTPTVTMEETPTPTPTVTMEETPTPTPTVTMEETPTPTPTVTMEETPTPTPTPSVAGYIVSGAGDPNYDGTYCLAGTSDGKNYYQKNGYYIFWSTSFMCWSIQSAERGGNELNVNQYGPDYYSDLDTSTPPVTGWTNSGSAAPSPSLTSTTC